MNNVRLPRSLCTIVGEAVIGSHATLNALFISAGAPGDPPELSHATKWKEWLYRAGQDPSVDSLAVLGAVLEEFMEVPPIDADQKKIWSNNKARVEESLEVNGFRYFQGGRVLPNDNLKNDQSPKAKQNNSESPIAPSSIDDVLKTIIQNLRRAIYPLSQRRKGAISLKFDSEYDIQDLLHSLLRPWIADIRPEEYTPSYAGSSRRMDFLLPKYDTVIETKLVRDRSHGRKIGEELIIDISHYKSHPDCKKLWCVVYDPNQYLANPMGVVSDLEGEHKKDNGSVLVKVFVV